MIKNLTPHVVCLFDMSTVTSNGNMGYLADDTSVCLLKLEASGTVARASQMQVEAEPISINGILVPTFYMSYGDPVELPDPEENVMLIVSALTANAAKQHGRTTDDLLIPSGVVRNSSGAVVGCTSFSRV